jgi:hypothetical protein
MGNPASALTENRIESISRQIHGRHRILALTVAVWTVAGALLLTRDPRAIAVGGSLVIGWSHLVGRCGSSHFGALTPRGKLPDQRSRWLTGVVVYLVAGAISSVAVGAALGALGGMVVPTGLDSAALALVLFLAGVAAASELRLIPWRLPQPSLQTSRLWGHVSLANSGSALGLLLRSHFRYRVYVFRDVARTGGAFRAR